MASQGLAPVLGVVLREAHGTALPELPVPVARSAPVVIGTAATAQVRLPRGTAAPCHIEIFVEPQDLPRDASVVPLAPLNEAAPMAADAGSAQQPRIAAPSAITNHGLGLSAPRLHFVAHAPFTLTGADGRVQTVEAGDRGGLGLPCTLQLGTWRLQLRLRVADAVPVSPLRTASLARELARSLLGERAAPAFSVVSGVAVGTRRELMPPDSRITIGRGDDADWQIADADLSRLHVAVARTWDGVFVYDLDSKNGTTVDGEVVDGSGRVLLGNEVLRMGQTELRFYDPASEVNSAATHIGVGALAQAAQVVALPTARSGASGDSAAGNERSGRAAAVRQSVPPPLADVSAHAVGRAVPLVAAQAQAVERGAASTQVTVPALLAPVVSERGKADATPVGSGIVTDVAISSTAHADIRVAQGVTPWFVVALLTFVAAVVVCVWTWVALYR